MKTTIDISDALLGRARRRARETGKSLRALVEEGLRLALAGQARRYHLPDRSVGKRGAADPVEAWSWQDLRDEIYGGR